MPNHAHALLRTGDLPLSRLAQRWLGPYATSFNRIHRRTGYLFQNRFKNTLVEEDSCLLELVRYIHLNPVRSRLDVSIDSLSTYPWTGHAVLLGQRQFPAQDVDFVLSQFGSTLGSARRAYELFVRAGIDNSAPVDLDGGGLRRSAGGWDLLPKLGRGRERWAFDERVLGSSAFVLRTLTQLAAVPLQPPHNQTALLTHLRQRVAASFEVTEREIASPSLRRPVPYRIRRARLHARRVPRSLTHPGIRVHFHPSPTTRSGSAYVPRIPANYLEFRNNR